MCMQLATATTDAGTHAKIALAFRSWRWLLIVIHNMTSFQKSAQCARLARPPISRIPKRW